MVQFQTIDGFQVQQHPAELEWMATKAKGKTNYIEIGIFNGGTFNYMSKLIKGKHIAVDISPWPERTDKLLKVVKNCQVIIGDTHKYSTLDAVRKALDGELVDVLFIDGDHTEEGVRHDYEMYKQFVSDGGLIFFHDIITSNFHAQHGCFVDRFWHTAPEPKSEITVSDEWGGIGCIENQRMDWKLYQIYFSKETEKHLQPEFMPYDNSNDKTFFFFENAVILDILKKLPKIKADYVGTCSWKFEGKTGMNGKRFTELVDATNGNYDVLLFPIAKHMHENVVERNRIYYSPIFRFMQLFDKLEILPFKMCLDAWTCSYCNYWLAKKSVYKDYCKTTLIPAMKAITENQEIKDFINVNPFHHNGRAYPIVPFLLELLMGFYVNWAGVSHKIITPKDSFIRLGIDEVMCEVLNKALVPSGKTHTKLKRKFALEMQANGHIKIIK